MRFHFLKRGVYNIHVTSGFYFADNLRHNASLRSKRFRGAKSEETGFWRFSRSKNGARAKIRRAGWGRGRDDTLAAKH